MKPEAMSNEELAEKIQNGDKSLVPVLWNRIYRLLYLWADKTCKKYSSMCALNAVSRDDFRQECYFVFLEALKHYRPPYSFTAFLKFPFLNMRQRLLKLNMKIPGVLYLDSTINEETEYNEIIPDEKNDIGKIIGNLCDRENLKEAFQKLTDKQKKVINLYYFSERTDSEIAEILGCKPASVCQLRHRALNAMRNTELAAVYESNEKSPDNDIFSVAESLTGGDVL